MIKRRIGAFFIVGDCRASNKSEIDKADALQRGIDFTISSGTFGGCHFTSDSTTGRGQMAVAPNYIVCLVQFPGADADRIWLSRL